MTAFSQTFTRARYQKQTPVIPAALVARAQRVGAGAPVFVRDLAIVLGVMALYFVARGLAPARLDDSVTLTTWLVRLEQELYVFWEPQIQDASIRYHLVQEVANFTYAYLHFPVLAVVGIWLWFTDRSRFVFLRNVMFVSMLIGIAFYYVAPAAPPRLMAMHGYELGFTDTVFGGETSVNYAQPSLILNEYAAIPSFHFGWIALASAAIWCQTRLRAVRAIAVFLTLLMTWAIVASANHLFIDMALGGAVIAASWIIVSRLSAPRARRSAVALQPVA